MTIKKTVLVFGATGQQGGAVARALRAGGWLVRALVRDPAGEKAKALASAGIDLYPGDFSDEASIVAAMSGVHGVFSVQPSSGQGPVHGISDEQELRYGKAIADLSLAHGVRHLVYTSVGAAGKGVTGLGHFDTKTEIEEHIRSLDIRSTIVRPAAFMEMLMLPGMGLDQGTYAFFMRPDQAMQCIAVDDIGKIVATIFSDPDRFGGQTIEIAGDAMTGNGLQDLFSRAAGRTITYHRFPDSLLEQNRLLGRLAELVDDGRCAGAADIPALREEFGDLLSLERWLSGPGRPLFDAALKASGHDVALR
ncbi:NmrA/HSCARG family protein [Azospirillum endophyticum]